MNEISLRETSYGEAIRAGFKYLLETYPETIVLGQGLWSPWYVGNSMTGLDKEFGLERVIDTPVSEAACTGAAIGASLAGLKPIVVHPRMDFMLYAMDAIVNQAAKWSHMFGGQAHPGLTVRGIINRGGEQGAQHSQALHSWFAHVPGLRVVMPSSVKDARDLLVASVLCNDPVIYVDDRWLYDQVAVIPEIEELDLSKEGPKVIREGKDLTIVAVGQATSLATEAASQLEEKGISIELIDARILNPFHPEVVVESVRKTGKLLAVDIGWLANGFSSEIIAGVIDRVEARVFKSLPRRLALPNAPAPTATNLEKEYYLSLPKLLVAIESLLGAKQ